MEITFSIAVFYGKLIAVYIYSSYSFTALTIPSNVRC